MGAGVRNITANLTDRIAVPMKISALFGARLAVARFYDFQKSDI